MNVIIKKWLFSNNSNRKYKKQQLLKALQHSYSNRKKKIKFKKNFHILYISMVNSDNDTTSVVYHNINFNWLLKK